jgi:S-DNA-T family DNA segregation ATPase FtsK/SpoIIIE
LILFFVVKPPQNSTENVIEVSILQVFSEFKERFNTDGYFKFRTIAVLTAVFLGFCGLWMGFSLVSAMFDLQFFPVVPGRFFVHSFGILSLLIPAYFFYAAVVLSDKKWRPDRIFLLNGFLIPFLTLSIGFVFIRDFDVRSQQSSFLYTLGKTGFSLFIITAAVLEILLLQVVRNILFFKDTRIMRKKILLPPPLEVSEKKTEDLPSSVVHEEDRETQTTSQMENSETDNEEVDELDEVDVGMDVETEEEDTEEDIEEDTDDIDAVTRALEEAEIAAAAHAELMRNKGKQLNNLRNKKYMVPVDILNEYPDGEYWVIDQATRDAAIALKETLNEFNIQAEVTGIRKGPVITMFEILPAPGVKLSKIVGLQDNIALRLAASSVRIVAPIPGKHAVGIEVPNAKRNIVSFKEIIENELQRSEKKMEIPVVMGKDITGEAQTVDLVQMPHLLIAGATGSGKSVCVNAIILSILYQLHPAECRLMLIDPKIVELKLYNDIPHLLTPVITDSKKAFQALQYCIYEMERRYACLDSMGVRDIRSYNKRVKEKNVAQEYMPYIVVVIDEYADLMTTTGKELESTVARLAAMSRAVGIHLVLATQRPSIDVITGLIKANIPSRIAFMVASKTDSRIIIDMVGAEKLLGKGDMLYSGVVDPFPIRMQGAFISEEEVESVVEYVKSFGEPDYIDDEIFFEEEEDDQGASLFSEGGDPLYEKALEIVHQQGKASASYIQRRLKIGFNRAARIVDEMEHNGVVGPANGSKPRELVREFGM